MAKKRGTVYDPAPMLSPLESRLKLPALLDRSITSLNVVQLAARETEGATDEKKTGDDLEVHFWEMLRGPRMKSGSCL